MFDILIIDKTAKIYFMKVVNTDNLYKKIGLKTEEGFFKHCEWNVSISQYSQLYINLYGKKIGKANNENKFNFPPPLDKEMFFGKCIVVAYTKNNKVIQHISLTQELWNSIYLKLTNINEIIVDIPKNKKIFLKNDELQLSSSEDENEEEDDEEEDEEEEIEDEELIEDIKEDTSDKIYLNSEIELIEEVYLSSSDEEEDTDEEDETDEDEEEDDMEYDDDDGDEEECKLDDIITIKIN